MSGMNNSKINAAYVATWQQNNPQLLELKTDGSYLYYQNEKLNIQDIYMQDILSNPNVYQSINKITARDLFNIIKLHAYAIKIKEIDLIRRMKIYEPTNE